MRAPAIVLLLTIPGVALVLGPGAWASVPEPGNPLLNQDFELGLADELILAGSALQEPADGVGSVLPRSVDPRARIAAPPWSATIFSGQRGPFSTTAWVLEAGERGSAALEVRYDARDAGVETLTIAQALGPLHLGHPAWRGASAVRLDVRGDQPVPFRVGLATAAEPTVWYFSAEARAPATLQRITLPLPVPADAPLDAFAVFVYGDASRDGARLVLDNVAVLGSRLLGAAEVPVESDVAVGRCPSPFAYAGPTKVGVPPADLLVLADVTVCVAGLMPFATVCVLAVCPPGYGGDNGGFGSAGDAAAPPLRDALFQEAAP